MLSRFEKFSNSIFCTYKYIQKIEADEMVKYGLKGSYAQYLAVMTRFPDGLTSARLSELCDKDKAAVSRCVNEMEKKGLVIRENSKSDNLYRARLKLTQSGKQAANHVCIVAKKAVELAGRGLSDEDRKIFYSSLDLIAANLKEISENGIIDD